MMFFFQESGLQIDKKLHIYDIIHVSLEEGSLHDDWDPYPIFVRYDSWRFMDLPASR